MVHAVYPFPGMNPYLESPNIWSGFRFRLVIAIADQIQPLLDPRYIASIESRKFSYVDGDGEKRECRQHFVEILDVNQNMDAICVIEVVSEANKQDGPARRSYLKKQYSILASACHLIELDLLRHGSHVVNVPEAKIKQASAYSYLVCVNRNLNPDIQCEVFPCKLGEPFPMLMIPLANPDADGVLNLQAAVEKVYEDGRNGWKLRYDKPCDPPLSEMDQAWANELLRKL